LKSEQHPWYDVINAGGKLVEQLYNEYGGFRNERITNVLLDADGKIVAWDVKGPELQWYLWKIFGK
jgi:hypothetical protein